MEDVPGADIDFPTTTFDDIASTLLATLTSSAIYASETLSGPGAGDVGGDVGGEYGGGGQWNSTVPHMGDDILPPESGNYFLVRLCFQQAESQGRLD